MSNRPRPSYARRRRQRHAITQALPVIRQVHGCTCDLEVRHGDNGWTSIGHDDGCTLIGRTQFIAYLPARHTS